MYQTNWIFSKVAVRTSNLTYNKNVLPCHKLTTTIAKWEVQYYMNSQSYWKNEFNNWLSLFTVFGHSVVFIWNFTLSHKSLNRHIKNYKTYSWSHSENFWHTCYPAVLSPWAVRTVVETCNLWQVTYSHTVPDIFCWCLKKFSSLQVCIHSGLQYAFYKAVRSILTTDKFMEYVAFSTFTNWKNYISSAMTQYTVSTLFQLFVTTYISLQISEET